MICAKQRPSSERRAQDGYILVAVLGVMLLLTGFMAAGSLLVRSALATARVGESDAGLVGLTQGGVELTAYQLFVIKAPPDLVDGRPIKFGDGMIVPRIDDEGGKADLNRSDPKLLGSVFRAVGLDGRTSDALLGYIVDMRGPDGKTSADSMQAADPSQASAASLQKSETTGSKKRRGFQSVDQIADLSGLSGSNMRALRPLLTVFNPDGKINIRSASQTMLGAIPGLSSADVSVILQRRDGASDEALADLTGKLAGAQAFIKTKGGPAFHLRIEATSANGRKKAVNAVIAASKSPNDPYYVLDWWE